MSAIDIVTNDGWTCDTRLADLVNDLACAVIVEGGAPGHHSAIQTVFEGSLQWDTPVRWLW
jgi:hypothetical protein